MAFKCHSALTTIYTSRVESYLQRRPKLAEMRRFNFLILLIAGFSRPAKKSQ
jgi:hypothetical protein